MTKSESVTCPVCQHDQFHYHIEDGEPELHCVRCGHRFKPPA